MRHGKSFRQLSRKPAHRKALLSNMACSLILHKRIKTTVAKAKELRMYVEPLLTKSKNDTTHTRRTIFSYLKNKESIKELFREIAPKISNRPGGYTRILKLGNRMSDHAEMCLIELVDYNQNMLLKEAPAKTKAAVTKRRRRKGKESRQEQITSQESTAALPEAKSEKETSNSEIKTVNQPELTTPQEEIKKDNTTAADTSSGKSDTSGG